MVDSNHIYWANGGRAIGRAKLDGTGADQGFIEADGFPSGVCRSESSHSRAPGCRHAVLILSSGFSADDASAV